MLEIEVKNKEEVSLHSERYYSGSLSKVAVFVDEPNLYVSSKKSDSEFCPSDILELSRRYGRVTQACVYMRLSQSSNGTEWWIKKYRKYGFEPRFIIDYNHDSESKDVDTYLVTDVLELAYTVDVDTFVIVSGDGDYVPLINLLRKLGKKTVVIAYENAVSQFLKGIADETVILDEEGVL